MISNQPLRILTWHVHGSYLFYLSQTPCIFILPYKEGKEEGYGARTASFPWGDNVVSVPADEIKTTAFDCILFQSRKNYLEDQHLILSEEQRALPKIYLEHDPPRVTPTDTRHVVNDPNILLVHVTHFNRLMWNNNRTPTRVITHGVMVPDHIKYTGELSKGIVVINGIASRGRRLGLDIFERVRHNIPLDIVGMDSGRVGGLGEVKNTELTQFIARYRFFFNPIRYTSLGLAVCEALMAGVPVVGIATTEMAVTIRNNHNGYTDTSVETLLYVMQQLLDKPEIAQRWSQGARETALEKFNIARFTEDWLHTFQSVVHKQKSQTINASS